MWPKFIRYFFIHRYDIEFHIFTFRKIAYIWWTRILLLLQPNIHKTCHPIAMPAIRKIERNIKFIGGTNGFHRNGPMVSSEISNSPGNIQIDISPHKNSVATYGIKWNSSRFMQIGGRKVWAKNLNLDVAWSRGNGFGDLSLYDARLKCCSQLWLKTELALYETEAGSIRERAKWPPLRALRPVRVE
jgi:hypothetical protein